LKMNVLGWTHQLDFWVYPTKEIMESSVCPPTLEHGVQKKSTACAHANNRLPIESDLPITEDEMLHDSNSKDKSSDQPQQPPQSRLAQLGLFEQNAQRKDSTELSRQLFEGLADVVPTAPNSPQGDNPKKASQPTARQALLPGMHDLSYKVFLQCLMRPQCTSFVRGMRLFLLSITGPNGDASPPLDGQNLPYVFYGTHQLVARCSDFFKQLSGAMESQRLFTEAFKDHPPFSVRNGLEKYVMTKIYNLAFPLVSDPEMDQQLDRQMKLLSFLTPANFDVNPSIQNETVLEIAQDELRKINSQRAPGDKIACVVRCCTVIFSVLNLVRTSEKRPGADDFLPVFIYVVLKANVPHLYSNCEFIEKFRNPHDMISKSGYCFVNLRSAIEFLLNLDASVLNIDSLEFTRKLQDQELKLRKEEAETAHSVRKSSDPQEV